MQSELFWASQTVISSVSSRTINVSLSLQRALFFICSRKERNKRLTIIQNFFKYRNAQPFVLKCIIPSTVLQVTGGIYNLDLVCCNYSQTRWIKPIFTDEAHFCAESSRKSGFSLLACALYWCSYHGQAKHSMHIFVCIIFPRRLNSPMRSLLSSNNSRSLSLMTFPLDPFTSLKKKKKIK